MKRIKITSFNNSFEQKSLAWRFVSISCPKGVSLNTSNYGRGDKMICTTPDRAIMCLNNKFVAGLIGLVPAHLLQSHSLHYAAYAHTSSAVAVLSVDAIFVN